MADTHRNSRCHQRPAVSGTTGQSGQFNCEGFEADTSDKLSSCEHDAVPLLWLRSNGRFIFLRKIDPHVLVRGELLEGRVHDRAEMEAAELARKRSQ